MLRVIELAEWRGLVELGRDYGRRTYELEREWDNEFGYLIFCVRGVFTCVYMYVKGPASVTMYTRQSLSRETSAQSSYSSLQCN